MLKALGESVYSKFETYLSDPDILSSRQNIATLEALILDHLEKLSQPDAALWSQAVDLYRRATEEQDVQAMRELGRLLERGGESSGAFEAGLSRIVALMKEQREHKRVEAKRELEQSTMLTQAEARLIVRRVWESLQDEAPDVRRRIGTKLISIFGDGPGELAA